MEVRADKTFKGKATAPIFPTAMLAYKQGDWAFSAVAGIFGGVVRLVLLMVYLSLKGLSLWCLPQLKLLKLR